MRQFLLKFYCNYLTIRLSNSVHINNTINERYNLLYYLINCTFRNILMLSMTIVIHILEKITSKSL